MRFLLLVALCSAGCGYKIQAIASPPGSVLSVEGADESVVLGHESQDARLVRLRYRPFDPQILCLSAPGYRTMAAVPQRDIFDASQLLRVAFRWAAPKNQREVHFVLVPQRTSVGDGLVVTGPAECAE